MFNIGAEEFLIIVVAAILIIGPKDMPLALRTAGRWIGKVRRVSGHFRSGLDKMIREAEMEEMEKKWAEQNAAIMKAHPDASAETRASAAPTAAELPDAPQMEPLAAPSQSDADRRAAEARERAKPEAEPAAQKPALPPDPPKD